MKKNKELSNKEQTKETVNNKTVSKSMNSKQKVNVIDIILRYPYYFIGILAFVIYFQSIFFGFVKLDDIPIIVNKFEYFKDISNIFDAFSKDAFINEIGNFYRPLQTASFIFDSQIGGGSPWIYHLTNILLHIVSCLLIFKILAAY